MVWVEIEKIDKKEWKGKYVELIFFHYEKRGINELQYTYLHSKVLEYWRKHFKNPDFNFEKGQKINVFNVPNSNMYSIKGVKLKDE